jgi:hypothetical protein
LCTDLSFFHPENNPPTTTMTGGGTASPNVGPGGIVIRQLPSDSNFQAPKRVHEYVAERFPRQFDD